MKWSWRIARVDGIDIYIHATFLLLLLWVGSSHWIEHRSLAATLVGVLFILAIFACVVLHELGHALAAKQFGIVTRDITLYPIGGVARLERMPDRPLQELWVAIAGPLVNVAIAALLFVVLIATKSWTPVGEMSVASGSFFGRLLMVNVGLVIFNLIPAFPMDGGRVLRAILALNMSYTLATQVAATIGQGFALLFGFAGILAPNPLLVFIALFIWIAAAQESSMIQMKFALAGIPVYQAMLTEFRVVHPSDTVESVLRLVLSGSQTDFPVVENGIVVGILTRAVMLTAVAQHGPQALVGDVMEREFQSVGPSEMLEVAFARLESCACRTLPVVQGNQLIGLVTADNVGEFLMVQAALAKRGNNAGPRIGTS